MCGRYTLTLDPADLQALFELSEPPPPGLAPRYNIAPSQPVAVVTGGASRKLELFQWGLIPSWAKTPQIGHSLINARAETVAEKPAFRAAFQKRRCLILADGFYEWQPAAPRKIPWHFQLEAGRPFAFAGLWEEWQPPEQPRLRSCAILTTHANALVEKVHDRMPVILRPADYAVWLAPGAVPANVLPGLFQPYPAAQMRAAAVSPLVSNPAHDSPECLKPV